MGTLNNALPYTLIVWGQGRIASGLASILNATTPLWTVLVAHLATADEKLTAGRLAGVVLGLAGVALLLGGAGGAAFGGEILPQLACLAGAVSYALAAVFGRRFRAMGVPPLATATGQLAAASLLLLPAALLVERPGPCRRPRVRRSPRSRPWRCSRPRSPTSSTSASWRPPGRPTSCS
jgi:drug/metabolite transporter (DMT)-like permease